MTQPTLADLAQRGAKCKAWAEWCKQVLASCNHPMTGPQIRDADEVRMNPRHYWTVIGPLPSCTYLDDQLGEFLKRAGVRQGFDGFYLKFSTGARYLAFFESTISGPMQKLEAAITIIERAHRIGEYAHYTESEAAPYMVAFLRGIGK